jgi:hypothetical protein
VEILHSAFRHGVQADDMQHVLKNALVIEEVADDPIRYLVLGPERSGNLLELVVMDRPQGPAVIHAMAMTEQYRDLLPKGWKPMGWKPQ